jgi:cytochrome c-type biogenesis protein CcsB
MHSNAYLFRLNQVVVPVFSSWINGLFLLLMLSFTVWMNVRFMPMMDGYEKVMAAVLPIAWLVLALFWRSLQGLSYVVFLSVVFAVSLYGGNLESASGGLLKYVLASQSAIVWMGVLILLSTFCYWLGFFVPSYLKTVSFKTGKSILWMAVSLGWIGFFVRWYESYLIAPDIGHVPISNLYEVFVLFILITALLYLYYEAKYETPALGGFVLLVLCLAVFFLYWYASTRDAHTITGLVPALQSWWMKIHVPANFIGYGSFSLAAMVAFATLLKRYRHNKYALWFLFGLAGLLLLEPLVFRKKIEWSGVPIYAAVSFLIAGLIVLARKPIVKQLPSFEVLDKWMQQSIALGFLFFTLATILGAMWAADAWGAYWQWDPKETWALIVWLNYAAWLHMRLVRQRRHALLAWWALLGLLITGFAFLGVNMFLSGLHSNGTL